MAKKGWEDLMDFEKSSTSKPRMKSKKEPSLFDSFAKPLSVKPLEKKSSNITSLSALIKACEPKEQSDLSVSRQKQNEIDDWFSNRGKTKILLISGPSGCGKTAALKVMAGLHGYDVMEWTTPMDSVDYETYTSPRQAEKFMDFLIRATRYNSILENNSRRLLLVKDVPNVFLVKPEIFEEVLEKYKEYGKEPLVFICTDGTTACTRILKALFPSDIRTRLGVDLITIPATTPTAMKNMLKRVAPILNKRASHMINATQSNIDEVLANSVGDVRSAILNLIFDSLIVPGKKSQDKESGSREETLGLLHAVGRVINPKRIEEGNSWKFAHNPDQIASNFLSQTSTFLHFLQQNYINNIGNLEEAAECTDVLSLSDTLTSQYTDANLAKLNLSLCIRGVMTTNINPKKGWNPVRKPGKEPMIMERNLTKFEDTWYRSIIRPEEPKVNWQNLDETKIDCDSD